MSQSSGEERSTPAVVNLDGKMWRVKTQNPNETYLRDQIDPNRSVTDLHLVCEDGHVPVHRYILMGTSGLVTKLLQDVDPHELAVIHLPEVKLYHVVQILSLIYTGKAVICKKDHLPIFSVMKMLGISNIHVEFRSSKPTDHASIPQLRFYVSEEGEINSEMEQTYVDLSLINDIHQSQSAAPEKSISSSAIFVEPEIEEPVRDNGPRVSSKRRIDKAESQRLLKLKVELPDEHKRYMNNETYKCVPCDNSFPTMEGLLVHLKQKCAERLNTKYIYNNRQCLVCNSKFPSYNIWGLLRHVKVCNGRSSASSSSEVVVLNITDSDVEKSVQDNDDSLDLTVVNGVKGNNDNCSNINGIVAENGDESNSVGLTNGLKVNATTKKRRKRRGLTFNKFKRRRTRQNGMEQDDNEVPDTTEDQEESTIIDPAVEETLPDSPAEIVCNIRIVEPESLTEKDPVSDEMDTQETENVLNAPFLCETVEMVSPASKQFPDIDPDIVRKDLGVNSPEDIRNLPASDLLNLLRQCPLCKNMYDKIKYVSKCLRSHGYRYCWVCLKLLPYKGVAFDIHNQDEHCIPSGSGDKVNCPLCVKEFEYKMALPTHLGNYHGLRIQDKLINNATAEQVPLTFNQSEVEEVEIFNTNNPNGPAEEFNDPNPPAVETNPSDCSKLRDILTAPSASPSSIQPDVNNRGRTTRKRSAENQRDGRLIIKLGKKLAKFKVKKGKQKERKRRSTTRDREIEDESFECPEGMETLSVNVESSGDEKQLTDEPVKLNKEDNQQTPPKKSTKCSSTDEPTEIDWRSSTPSTSADGRKENEDVESKSNEPVAESAVINEPQIRTFLGQRVMGGILHDIYCKAADPKKLIAIPASKVRKEDG